MVLKAAIVEDEPLARSRLRRLLKSASNGSIMVVVECVDVEDVLTEALQTPIDVLFLDIELPGGDGFTALRRWPGPPPMVVFVTAYGEHGVRAFEDRAVDYLMKPVSLDRIRDTIGRLEQQAAVRHGITFSAGESERRHAMPVGRRKHLIPESCIELICADGNYLEVKTSRGNYTIRRTLGDFIAELDGRQFMRVHRSTVVRSSAVTEVTPIGSGRFELVLRSGERIATGRNYRELVQKLAARRSSAKDDSSIRKAITD